MCGVRLDTLRALAGVADRPHAAVELAGDVLHQRLVAVHLDVLEHLVGESELPRELVEDGLIRQTLEDRVDDLVPPLEGAVRCGHRAVGLELGRRRQQVDAVAPVAHHRRVGGIGIDHHHRVELLHRDLHLRSAGLAVDGVAVEHHHADVVALTDVVLQHSVHPARHRDALVVHGHHFLAAVADDLVRIEAALEPVEVDLPDPGPVRPGPGGESVVAGEGVRQHAEVGRALHVVMAPEDVGAAALLADVAERELEHAVGARVVVADGVLGAAHAPYDGARPVLGHHLRGGLDGRFRHSGDPLRLLGGPLFDLLADLVHAVDALADVLLVFPAVLEDVPQQSPHDPHVGAGANLQVDVGVGGGSRETRVRHDHLGAVLLRPQDVLHRHRVRFSRVAADEEHRPGVVHVVVRVRHRPVAPGIRYPGHGGGMTDSRLVIDVVRTPEGGELAEQVGLLVAVLGGAEPVHRVRARFLPHTAASGRRSHRSPHPRTCASTVPPESFIG